MKENIIRRMIEIIAELLIGIASIFIVAFVFTVYCVLRMSSICSREEEKDEINNIQQ